MIAFDTPQVTTQYNSISAMQAYSSKSHEELRWEDYQQGIKNASAGPAPAAPATGLFGAAAPAASPFGLPPAAAPAAGGAFGAAGAMI